MSRSIVALASMLLLLLAGTFAQAQPAEVTTCGQVVGPEGGFLNGDLDCSSFDGGSALLLFGRLELNGHTITGSSLPPVNAFDSSAVYCPPPDSSCEVIGPGLLAGSRDNGILVEGKRAFVSGVTLADNAKHGVSAHYNARLAVEDSTITRNGWNGVQDAARVARCSITLNGAGEPFAYGGLNVGSGSTKVEDTDVSQNYGSGVLTHGARVTLKRVTVTGNARDGVHSPGGKLKIVDSLVRDNKLYGIKATNTLRLSGSVVTNNGHDGASALYRLVASRSTITGNCTSPKPGCFDVVTCLNPPKVNDLECGTSGDCQNQTWGVCALD